jgi:hypothetical protein
MIISINPKFSISPDCVPKLIKIIKQHGFLTGSKKFGLNTNDSDIDYVILSDYVVDIVDLNLLNEYNENCLLPCLSLKIKFSNMILNVIVAKNENELNAWIKSTNQFVDLLNNKIFKKAMIDKDTRINFFERLREINGIPNKK